MTTTYNIKILNKSQAFQNYFVFAKPPAVSGTLGQVYSNAWITFPDVPDSGTAFITYTDELYAYWGTVPKSISPGVTVSGGQGLPVTLGPKGTNYFSLQNLLVSTLQKQLLTRLLDSFQLLLHQILITIRLTFSGWEKSMGADLSLQLQLLQLNPATDLTLHL